MRQISNGKQYEADKKDLGRAGYLPLIMAIPGRLSLPVQCQQEQLMPHRSVLVNTGRL